MNYQRMTDRSRKILRLAENEAFRRGSAMVEPEHILLGLALEGSGVAANVLRILDAPASHIAKILPSVERLPLHETSNHLLSAPSQSVVDRALNVAKKMGHNYIGTEHLLVAVAYTNEGRVPEILADLALEPKRIEREVCDILGYDLQNYGTVPK